MYISGTGLCSINLMFRQIRRQNQNQNQAFRLDPDDYFTVPWHRFNACCSCVGATIFYILFGIGAAAFVALMFFEGNSIWMKFALYVWSPGQLLSWQDYAVDRLMSQRFVVQKHATLKALEKECTEYLHCGEDWLSSYRQTNPEVY